MNLDMGSSEATIRCSNAGPLPAMLGQLSADSLSETVIDRFPLGTRRFCDVKSTSKTLIQRRNNIVCPVGCQKRIPFKAKAA